MPRGGHLVFGLGVGDGEAQAADGAPVVDRDLGDRVGIGLLGARRGE